MLGLIDKGLGGDGIDMRSHLRQLAVVVLMTFAVGGVQGCGFYYSLQAKNRLNEGIRTFNKGKYEEARDLFKEAIELDPDNLNARLFYATALNAEFQKSLNSQDVDKSGAVTLGENAIKAFEELLAMKPEFKLADKATAFIANAYKSLRGLYNPEREAAKVADMRAKYLAALEQRAGLIEPEIKRVQELVDAEAKRVASISAPTDGQKEPLKKLETELKRLIRERAQMYYTIADDYWREGHSALEKYAKKDPANPSALPTYPEVPESERARISAIVAKSKEYMNLAIAADADYPEPYLGQKLLVMDLMNATSDLPKKEALRPEKDKWDELHRDKLSAQQAAEAALPTPAEAGAGTK